MENGKRVILRVALSILTIVAVIVISVVVKYVRQKAAEKALELEIEKRTEKLLNQSTASAEKISFRAQENLKLAADIKDELENSTMDRDAIISYEKNIRDSYSDIKGGLVIITEDGNLYDDSGKLKEQVNPTELQTYQRIYQYDSITTDMMYIDKITGRIVLPAGCRLDNFNGMTGVMQLELTVDYLSDILSENPALDNGLTFVVDTESGMIISVNGGDDISGSTFDQAMNYNEEIVDFIGSSKDSLSLLDYNSVVVMTKTNVANTSWVVFNQETIVLD